MNILNEDTTEHNLVIYHKKLDQVFVIASDFKVLNNMFLHLLVGDSDNFAYLGELDD